MLVGGQRPLLPCHPRIEPATDWKRLAKAHPYHWAIVELLPTSVWMWTRPSADDLLAHGPLLVPAIGQDGVEAEEKAAERLHCRATPTAPIDSDTTTSTWTWLW